MSKILIVSEGQKPDKKIIEHLLNLYKNRDIEYEIVTYNTNIHIFYQNMKIEYEDDIEDVQLIPILKEKNPEFNFNKDDFSEIYLFFDYDIHHREFERHDDCEILNKQLREMLKFFDDETGDRGKLYINYPMVESFFHISFDNINIFKDTDIELSEINAYKSNSCFSRIKGQFVQNSSRFDLEKINLICEQHIKKENYIISGNYIIPDYSIYSTSNQLIIFENQVTKYVNIGKISVLSVFPRFIVDYFGEEVFNLIKRD